MVRESSSGARRGSAVPWVDLHTHILPGMDDGARDLVQAVAMARIAEAEGIGTLVATPHNLDWPAGDHRPTVRHAVADLNAALAEAGVHVRVLAGVESYLWPDMGAVIRSGQALTLAGSDYILVELPMTAYPLYTEQVIFDLQIRGLSIVLAHPERNVVIGREPARLIPLVERGVLIQLTALSITGGFGAEAQQASRYLLRSKLAHIIASDAHNAERRAPALRAAVAAAGELIGQDRAEAMVSATPAAIINNQPVVVDAPAPAQPEKKRFWARLFSHA
jgi:protein-tyrosine phosphatase